MKKKNLLYGFIIGLLVFSSCSYDDLDTDDIIIGKWRVIERFESDLPVVISVCQLNTYVEYKIDKAISGNRIESGNFPEECNNFDFELGWNWKNLGNNQYEIRYLEEQGQIYTMYKEGDNLVQELPDGITKNILERY